MNRMFTAALPLVLAFASVAQAGHFFHRHRVYQAHTPVVGNYVSEASKPLKAEEPPADLVQVTVAKAEMPIESQLVASVNEHRARYGLRALVVDPALQVAARAHSAWMARNHSLSHSNAMTENISMGRPDVGSVMAAWMNSSGHRANILGGYNYIGVAAERADNGTIYWTQQFSR